MIENKRTKIIIGTLSHSVLIFCALCCVIPFVLLLTISVSSIQTIQTKGYTLIPQHIDLISYIMIFKNPDQIMHSYWVTIKTTAVGTFLSILVNTSIAYPLSRKDFIFRNKISFYVFFTMMFGGGLVPTYILITNLGLIDKFPVLWLPSLTSAFFILLLRTYFAQIPYEVIESAKIDGAGEFRIYLTMILPLSKPAIATVALLRLYGYWNDYFTPLLFTTTNSLTGIQYYIYQMISNIAFFKESIALTQSGVDLSKLPSQGMLMAMTVLSILPIMVIFPFFQKYLVKGIIVGSVKG
jgi:ABC-type sugar transport system, permease component